MADLLRELKLADTASFLRTYRHKAYFSLDYDVNVERDALVVVLTPADILEQKEKMIGYAHCPGRSVEHRHHQPGDWPVYLVFRGRVPPSAEGGTDCGIQRRDLDAVQKVGGGIPTGATQNPKDLLSSPEIENILENSDFIYMLNQAVGDRKILAERLNISSEQLAYVTNSEPGHGLLFFNNVILPFADDFPKDTELYKLLTTKPSEVEH